MVDRKNIVGGGGETGAGARGIGGDRSSLARFTFHRAFIFLPFHYLRAWNRLAECQHCNVDV